MEELYASLCRFLGRRLPSGVDPRDVAQETWLIFLEKFRHATVRNARALLFEIARLKLKESRRQKSAAARFDSFDSQRLPPADRSSASSVVATRERLARIRDSFGSLSHAHQQVISLSCGEDMTPQEIGRLLDQPPTTIKSRIQRARRLLKRGDG